jgi:hypothetical protein
MDNTLLIFTLEIFVNHKEAYCTTSTNILPLFEGIVCGKVVMAVGFKPIAPYHCGFDSHKNS